MSNELTPFGGATELTDEKALMQQMQEQANFGARGGGGISYMSFSGKKGIYKIGVEGRSLEPNEPFLVAVPLFKTGYICWRGGKPIAKRMAGLREPQIMQPDPDEGGPFTDDKDGWSQARSMGAKSLMNEEEIEFTINSKSGVAAIADLQRQVLEQMAAGKPFWPIVTFGTEEFESKGYKNDKPVITPIKWLDSDEIKEWSKEGFDPMTWLDDDEDEAPKEDVAPKRRNRNL